MPARPPASKKLPGKDFGRPQANPIADSFVKNSSLTIDEKMFTLTLLAHQWSHARIARRLHRDTQMIRTFRNSFVDNPSAIV